MKYVLLLAGLLWPPLSTCAEDCRDPLLLNPTYDLRATLFSRVVDEIQLYHCTVKKTYIKYLCEDFKVGITLEKGKSTYAVTGKKFLKNELIFKFRDDTNWYSIRTNESHRTYINPLNGYVLHDNTCVGKLEGNQTVTKIWQVDIKLTNSIIEYYVFSPPDRRHHYVVSDCLYYNEYCYNSSTHEHTFWKAANPQVNNSYGFEVFENSPIYTMTKDPLSQYLLLSKNNKYMAVQLVKLLSFHPDSNLTYWQTDHQLNVTFQCFRCTVPSDVNIRRTIFSLEDSRREAFYRMRARCRLQQLEYKLKTNLDTTLSCDFYLLFFLIFLIWSFINIIIKVTVNYCTLRRLGYIRVGGCKMFISATSHAVTNRYIANHQHEGYDYLIVKLAMVGTEMETQSRQLNQLSQMITEMTNQRQPIDYTYDYVTTCPINNLAAQATATDQQECVGSTEQHPKKRANRAEYANLPNMKYLP